MIFPPMTVEKRPGKSHGLRPPSEYGSAAYKEQFNDALELAQLAKKGTNEGAFYSWKPRTVELLKKYIPFEPSDIPSTMAEFGFGSWADVTKFVMDDECIELAVRVAKWAKKNKIKPKDETRGFIDGDGLGWYYRWYGVTKPILEKAFDEKYYHKATRPQVDIVEMVGHGAECVANYPHPGHWRYPAGHGSKFAATARHAIDELDVSAEQILKLKTMAIVAAHGRTGGFVHLPEDNAAPFVFAGFTEFNAEYLA